MYADIFPSLRQFNRLQSISYFVVKSQIFNFRPYKSLIDDNNNLYNLIIL